MRSSLLVGFVGLAAAASVVPAAAQGIGLPVTPRQGARVEEPVIIHEIRTETARFRLQQAERAAIAADRVGPDSITRNDLRYEIAAVEGDQAIATRTYVAEVQAVRLSDPQPCQMAGSGLFRWRPARRRTQSECFWNQSGIQTLNHASLSGTGDSRSMTVDLVSDLIGPVRAYVVGSIAAAGPEEDEDEAGEPSTQAEETKAEVDANVQKFLTSGGNAVLGLMYPAFTFQSATMNSGFAPNFMTYMTLAPRIGFDVPAGNTSSDNPKVNVDFGPELTMAAHGDQLALFAQARWAMVAGTPEFYRGLSLAGNDPFGYGRVNVGLRLRVLGYTNVLLSWSKPFSGPDQLLQSGSQLHFTVQKEAPQPANP